MLKKFILPPFSLLLICLVILGPLTSCSKKQPENAEETTSTDQQTENITSEQITSSAEEDFHSLDLVKDGKTEFTLLWPMNTSEEQEELLLYFKDKFKDRTGINLKITYEKEDDVYGNNEFEILIGNNTRKETVELVSSMRNMDYCYGIYGNKLVFAGGSIAATKSGVQYFIRKFLDSAISKDAENITFTQKDNYYEKINYFLQDFKIGDVDAYKYTIIYSKNDFMSARLVAYNLRTAIINKYGYAPNIATDEKKESEYEIIIGNTNRGHPEFSNDKLNILFENGKLYIHCGISSGYEYMINYLSNTVLGTERSLKISESSSLSIPLSEVFKGGTENIFSRSGDIRIIFNNVWSGNTTSAPASIRALYLKEMFVDYSPDIICLQEYSGAIKTNLSKYLKELGYKEINYASKNQDYAVRTPVYYDPTKVSLVDSGFWAFNDTANDKSKSIGWGVFKDKSGKLFCVASTHFYWTSDELGEYARKIDATELCEQMKIVSEKYGNIPIIIGGDYNCKIDSEPLKILKSNNFTDIENTAVKTELNGTHHSYPTINSSTGVCTSYSQAGGTNESAIDHVFSFSDSNLTVNLYDVIEDYLALASSDHCPILTDITLK